MYQVVRCFLFNSEGKFVLVKHKWRNHWVLPGWHIEKWENLIKAMKREIKEELGIKIKFIGHELDLSKKVKLKEYPVPVCMYKLDYVKKSGKIEKRFEYIFMAQIKPNEIIKTQIDEIDDYKFFTPEEIQNLDNTYDQIKEIVKKLS